MQQEQQDGGQQSGEQLSHDSAARGSRKLRIAIRTRARRAIGGNLYEMSVTLRKATTADRQFLLDLVPRLRAFGPPPLRPAEALDEAERRALNRALDDPQPDRVIFVGELPEVGPAGIAYVETATDYFTGERHGHLAILIVDEEGEGKGVGKALLAAVEEWAAAQGYRFITLNVFAGNTRARTVYERAGYSPDTVRYAKELNGSTGPHSPRSS